MNTIHNVLDHGFVRVVDTMGDDTAIVQAARVSYGTGTKTVSEDSNLIDYLMYKQHTTPFEMCEIKLHCKMPLFVARQWVRHRTANINEYSGRYSIMSSDYYVPTTDQIQVQAFNNKQGRGAQLNSGVVRSIIRSIEIHSTSAYNEYMQLLNTSLSRELARMVLPVNFYTEWYWKIDLHNLMHFLKLRMDSHAQYEIRVYADTIAEIVKVWCPEAWKAFERHQLQGAHLSREALQAIVRHTNITAIGHESSGMKNRERSDLINLLQKSGRG